MATVPYADMGSVAGALIIAGMFIKSQYDERRDRKAERESFIKTIDKVGDAVSRMCTTIEHCPNNTKGGSN
ncbi:MAG: hypothetical protein ABFE07_06255 [Armatimonadia bacterium]